MRVMLLVLLALPATAAGDPDALLDALRLQTGVPGMAAAVSGLALLYGGPSP